MKKIVSFLKQRWLVSLLGLIVLALLVWYIGPLFSFAEYKPLGSERNRLILIATIFLVWLFKNAWSFAQAKLKNSQIINAMAGGAETTPSQEELASQDEIQILKERMQEALNTLKKTRLGNGSARQSLYQLPWYILIGPPGSGKTTLLRNSNLKFPLADHFGDDAIRGVGGTRHCDWWFAEDAVLLDTAGRYTTQDSHQEVDRSTWLGFLYLLKKHRRRRPISGAIIAVSITDLLSSNEAERLSHAKAIRERIDELHEHLNIRFPIYLLFTKTDLLAGFMQYFDEFDHDNRAQVWGMTFPVNEAPDSNPVEQLDEEFKRLELHLQDKLLYKLDREQNQNRRDLIYTFPQQFSALKSVVSRFSNAIFQTNPYTRTGMLRGIYFTSATQEGSPIDKIMGSLARRFGLDQQSLAGMSGTGKSYFINHLLKKVIFSESGLAGANLKFERRQAWLQRGAILVTVSLTFIISLAWFVSYTRNIAYIDNVSQQADALQISADALNPEQSELLETLPLINAARNLPAGFYDQLNGTPWLMTFGLYQGDKLGQASESIYRKLLNQVFMTRLMTRLEQQIRDHGNNTDYLYEALKVYLMLGNKHFDQETIRTWIHLDWDTNLPLDVTNEQRISLKDNLDVLIESRPIPLPRPLDDNLVAQARKLLNRVPLAERIYGRIKLELSTANIAEFRINEAAGRDASIVFTRSSGEPLSKGVAGMFTYKGYHNYFIPENKRLTESLADENWIFGTQSESSLSEVELELLRQEVRKLYLDDYARQWSALLNDIRIVPFKTLEETVQILNIISGVNSPMRLVLEAVEWETTLQRDEEQQSLVDRTQQQLSAAKSKLSAIIGKTPIDQPTQQNKAPRYISEQFKQLNALVQSSDGNPPPIERVLALLNELYVYLSPLVQASGEEMVLEQRKQVAELISKVKTEARRQPYPVNGFLNKTASALADIVGGGICQHLNAVWENEIFNFCTKAISGRYPIRRDSPRDITHEDFGLFFGPTGKIDTFFKKYLSQSVDKSRQRWRWISRNNSPACLSDSSLEQFKRAEIIRDTFFRNGGSLPSIGFSLKPVTMNDSIFRLYLDVDGQSLNYAHEQPRVIPMKWPGPNNSGQVSLQISPPVTGDISGISFEGPWALFKLFDQAKINPLGSSEKFILAFDIDGRESTLELRANSAFNPFQLNELQNFRCPTQL